MAGVGDDVLPPPPVDNQLQMAQLLASVTQQLDALQQRFEAAQQQQLPSAPTSGAAAPAHPGVALDPRSPFAPLQSHLFRWDAEDKTFRLLDFSLAPWHTALSQGGRTGYAHRAQLEELTMIQSLTFYSEAVLRALLRILDRASSEDAEATPLASVLPQLTDICASTEAIFDALTLRSGYLSAKAVSTPEQAGEIADLRSRMLVRLRALPSSGSSFVDSTRNAYRENVNTHLQRFLARASADVLHREIRGQPERRRASADAAYDSDTDFGYGSRPQRGGRTGARGRGRGRGVGTSAGRGARHASEAELVSAAGSRPAAPS